MIENFHRRLISGRISGPAGWVLRFLLAVVSVFYGLAIRLRNGLYRRGVLKIRRVEVPVISIGNLTTGGTGKTPLVIWTVRRLLDRGLRCAVLTRGYKTRPGTISDEPAILAKSCGGADIVVDPDRIRGAHKAIERFGAQVLVMDDGFQHRRLARDLDILAVDATCPFGFGKILPAGLLREPVSALRRADAVVITRYDQVSAEKLNELTEKIRYYAPAIPIALAAHINPFVKIHRGPELPLDGIRERKILAFCGVGNPEAFFRRLDMHGFDVIVKRVFGDHYPYRERDVADILQHARLAGADLILTTQKDWVKTALFFEKISPIELAYLGLELDFTEGGDTIDALIDKTLNTGK